MLSSAPVLGTESPLENKVRWISHSSLWNMPCVSSFPMRTTQKESADLSIKSTWSSLGFLEVLINFS
jgi:hypothetical protein